MKIKTAISKLKKSQTIWIELVIEDNDYTKYILKSEANQLLNDLMFLKITIENKQKEYLTTFMRILKYHRITLKDFLYFRDQIPDQNKYNKIDNKRIDLND